MSVLIWYLRSCWLRWHGVSIVNDHADMVSVKSMTTPTWCQCSQQPRWHRVSVVNNYRIHICLQIFTNIFAKTKNFAKPFLPVPMGPRWSLFRKKCRKSCDSVPLRLQSDFFLKFTRYWSWKKNFHVIKKNNKADFKIKICRKAKYLQAVHFLCCFERKRRLWKRLRRKNVYCKLANCSTFFYCISM